MGNLDATVSGASANSYLTITDADALLFSYAQYEKWQDLEEVKKEALLVRAARLIDSYRGWGPKREAAQSLAFPRAIDAAGVIPKRVKSAVCEYVDYELEGDRVPIKKVQAEGVASASILGQSMSFEKDESQLPAGSRRQLDQIFRAHWPVGTVNRELDGSTDPDSFFG